MQMSVLHLYLCPKREKGNENGVSKNIQILKKHDTI